jgi:uncharacterized RDD family membrane protein YckC
VQHGADRPYPHVLWLVFSNNERCEAVNPREVVMVCPSCGADVQDKICPKCRAKAAPGAVVPPARVETDAVLRAGAFLIDVMPAIVAWYAIIWIPIVGGVVLGIVLLDYWLLRDITGASLGKMALGLRVVKKDGSSSDLKERILRNVTLAIGPALLIAPMLSPEIPVAAAGILALVEGVFLWVKDARLGDRLAGTTVVKKAAEKQAGLA